MTAPVDRSAAYCVIGAGAAGLAAAKNLMEYGFEVDVIEREDGVGGNWYYGRKHSSVYDSIHLITSKRYIEYDDFPIPAEYPTYLGHRHARAYFDAYAKHYGLYPHIEFERSVEWVDRRDGSPQWIVTLDGGECRRYGGLVIANGHNWKPRLPSYPGHFNGLTLHSADYKKPDVFAGKRVLVVGGGTSGCDIAVESSQVAAATYLSIRRGCYYWPKYLFGLPTDMVYEKVLKLHMPRSLVRLFGGMFLRLNSAGSAERYGLPKPSHRLLEEHFVINSTLLYQLGHGEIIPRPDVAELTVDGVRFTDGSSADVDVIVYATGYHQTEFPFIDRRYLNWHGRTPHFHLNAFHPVHDNLFVIGYFQTSTGNWKLLDYQAQIMARYLRLIQTDPQRAAAFRKEKASPVTARELNNGIRFYDSERHWLQVEHAEYRALLRKLIRKLDVKPPQNAAAGARRDLPTESLAV